MTSDRIFKDDMLSTIIGNYAINYIKNFVSMQNIYNFVQRIRQTFAITDRAVVPILFAKLSTETTCKIPMATLGETFS